MDNTIVIYKSRYGTTRRYAKWISEELGCSAVSVDEIKKRDLKQYDTIIYGGSIRAGGIRELDKFLKWVKSDLKIMAMYHDGQISREDMVKTGAADKRILIFAVGINIDGEEARKQLREINFPKKYMKELPCFCLPGDYDPTALDGADKFVMNMATKMLKGKREADMNDDERSLLKKMEQGCKLVDRSRIQPIIEAVRK